MNSNGKEAGIGRTFTPPSGYRNTTAMGLLAAGSRAISAPTGPLILPGINPELWVKKEILDSPDSGGWSTPTPPLRQVLFSSFKNRPTAFPLNIDKNESNPSIKSSRSSNSSSYRNREKESIKEEQIQQPMQVSDYDNLKSEMVRILEVVVF